MDFDIYQKEAAKTNQVVGNNEKEILVPLLGLAGEVGTLLSEYKKFLRDGGAHQRFEAQVAEDLGDLIWYIANVASYFELNLNDIAKANIEKTKERWPAIGDTLQQTLFDSNRGHLYDEVFSEEEQIPRKFKITFTETKEGENIVVRMRMNDKQVGDPLTDNAYDDDGYRFHDVFHLSYAAILGWSPLIRKLLSVKRKSNTRIDEVEDGARARIIEELISQLVYTYAREHNYLEGVGSLDYHLLKTIQALVADREVSTRSLADWEKAILDGYVVWRKIRDNHGGEVEVNLIKRHINYID